MPQYSNPSYQKQSRQNATGPPGTTTNVKEGRKRTRQELWESSYRADPYLRKPKEEELYSYGQELLGHISPMFLKNGTPASDTERMSCLEQFTHLLEEVNHRGLDMRKLQFDPRN